MKQSDTGSSRTTLIVIGALLAVVVAVGVLVVVLTGGDDDEPVARSDSAIITACPDADVSVPDPAAVPVDQAEADSFAPVGIAGDALAPYTQEIMEGAADPARCEVSPVISGYTYGGDPITIDPAVDGPTLIVFLAHWCPHCNREIPVLNEWRDSGDVPDGLNVVGVSTGVAADRANFPPDTWLESMDWTWPALADDDLSADDGDPPSTAFRAYGAGGFPTLVFVGGDGRVLYRVSGELPIAAIQQLADETMSARP